MEYFISTKVQGIHLIYYDNTIRPVKKSKRSLLQLQVCTSKADAVRCQTQTVTMSSVGKLYTQST